MNLKNDGRPFEKQIETVLTQYAGRRVMKVEKVDAPCRIFGGRVIFMANPFLDYVGTWTARDGRMITFEAKSTSKPRLPLCQAGGLSLAQWEAMRYWQAAGAMVFLLWQFHEGVRMVWPQHIARALWEREQKQRAARVLQWDDRDGTLLQQGLGHVYFDFVTNLNKMVDNEPALQ